MALNLMLQGTMSNAGKSLEIAALLTRVVKPETRLTLTGTVAP